MTRILLIAIAIVAAAGTWRLARWYWRPRLVLPAAPSLEPAAEGFRVFFDVRNEGSGSSRGCRAVLIRCERKDPAGWLRIEPRRTRAGDPNSPGTGIPPNSTRRIELDHALPAEPGTYRFDIGVLNGEEKRSSYVVEIEAVPSGASP